MSQKAEYFKLVLYLFSILACECLEKVTICMQYRTWKATGIIVVTKKRGKTVQSTDQWRHLMFLIVLVW